MKDVERLDGIIAGILQYPDKENANIRCSPSGKMLQIGSNTSKMYYLSQLPNDIANAHVDGYIHIHDLDYYGKCVNCLVVPLRDLLENGFHTGNGFIRPPKRFSTATALTAIIVQSTQNDQFGGVAINNLGSELAPFVKMERERICKDLANYRNCDPSEILQPLVESKLRSTVYQAMEGLVHNLNSMHSRAGNQVPFSSINIGMETDPDAQLVDEMLLRAYAAGLGKGEVPLWPQIIFKVKKGLNREPGTPGYYLFKLAMEVASKNVNPTFLNVDSSFNKSFDYECQSMGCRTRIASNVNGREGSRGRGNLFFVTINLPRLALESGDDINIFWDSLDDVLSMCERQLLHRYDTVKTLKVKDIPFIMGQGLYLGSENLGPEDSIEPAIKNGTLSIGFIGLAEALKALVGKHHGECQKSLDLGYQIVAAMDRFCKEAAERNHLNFTLIATPAEGVSYQFVEIDRQIYGSIPGVTDKEYYTNSFHIPVSFPISLFDKMQIEGAFHKYCPAGHISYIEIEEAPEHNALAYEQVLNWMCDQDCGYFGINFPIDFCADCGQRGLISEDKCPSCGSTNIRRVRKITGYLGFLEDFNRGKAAEVRDRVTHSESL
jgi:anaerobic ribonucleoside-triphosphate reductase